MIERFKPIPYEPNLPFDWATGGRQLSEEEREIAQRIPKARSLKLAKEWPFPQPQEKQHDRDDGYAA